MSIINAPSEFHFSRLMFKSYRTMAPTHNLISIRMKELECSSLDYGDEVNIVVYRPDNDTLEVSSGEINANRNVNITYEQAEKMSSSERTIYQMLVVPADRSVGIPDKRLVQFISDKAVFKQRPRRDGTQLRFSIPSEEVEALGVQGNKSLKTAMIKKPEGEGMIERGKDAVKSINRSMFRVKLIQIGGGIEDCRIPEKRARMRGYKSGACYQFICF